MASSVRLLLSDCSFWSLSLCSNHLFTEFSKNLGTRNCQRQEDLHPEMGKTQEKESSWMELRVVGGLIVCTSAGK